MVLAMYIPISIVAYSTYLLTYLLILFRGHSSLREIIVVSLRYFFKNPSEWRRTSLEKKKEGKKEQMVPCIFPHRLLLILLIYLLILFRDGSSSREIVVVSLRWSFKNSSDHRKERKKEQMILPMYIPYQLLLILLTYFIP